MVKTILKTVQQEAERLKAVEGLQIFKLPVSVWITQWILTKTNKIPLTLIGIGAGNRTHTSLKVSASNSH